MGRGGDSSRRGRFSVYGSRRRCPDCGCGEHDFHTRDCRWALENDPASTQSLQLPALAGKTLKVVAADHESIRFTVEGEPGEVYEISEVENGDETTDGEWITYKEFSFSRVEPRPKIPRPKFPSGDKDD